MKWQNVENQCKITFGNQFFYHLNPIERRKMINIIADEYPEMHRLHISAIVDAILKRIKSPISSNEFLMQIHHSLR